LKFAVFAAPGTILDAAKEQFIATCEEIKCFYSIFNAEDLARLFVAHGFLCPRDASRISAGRCKCGYSPKKRILNLFQKEALDGLSTAHSLGQKTGLVVLCNSPQDRTHSALPIRTACSQTQSKANKARH
jgi:hypothetical protein